MTLDKKQFYIDNICDTNNDKKEMLDLTGFESNFSSSPFTYEYYDNQSDLRLGQNKINPKSYAYDGNSGDPTIYVKVSQEGFCPDFYTINVVLKTTPMIEIPDYYYCKNDMVGLEIKPNFDELDVVYYKWEYPDREKIEEGADKDFISGVKKVGTYTLTLTNSLGCTYTTTFKVLNEETPRIVSLKRKIAQISSNQIFLRLKSKDILNIAIKAKDVQKYSFDIINDDFLKIRIIRKIPLNLGYLLGRLQYMDMNSMNISF